MAGRILTFIMLISTITIMLYVAGITTQNQGNVISLITQFTGYGLTQDCSATNLTATEQAQCDKVGSITGSDIYAKIEAAILVIILTASGAALLFGNASAAITIGKFGLIPLLVSFGSDYLFLLTEANKHGSDWTFWIVSIVFVPIIIGFIWTFIEFVGGNE